MFKSPGDLRIVFYEISIFAILVLLAYNFVAMQHVIFLSLLPVMWLVFYGLGGKEFKSTKVTPAYKYDHLQNWASSLCYGSVVALAYVALRVMLANDELNMMAVWLFLAEFLVGSVIARYANEAFVARTAKKLKSK